MTEQKEQTLIVEANFVVFLQALQTAIQDGWEVAQSKPMEFYNVYRVIMERTPKRPVGRPTKG